MLLSATNCQRQSKNLGRLTKPLPAQILPSAKIVAGAQFSNSSAASLASFETCFAEKIGMTHKVHPKVFKIREGKDWLSRGFYKKKFPQYLEEDFQLREFLTRKLPARVVESIEIERGETLLKIIIKTARPALIIGRGGEEVEKLKKDLERFLTGKKKEKAGTGREIKIEIAEVKEPWGSASLVSQWVASQIEKRVPFRRCLKMALSKIMATKGVKGARVKVSGRLNGIEISRTEWLGQGEMPRHNLRAVIDYGFSQAYCTYGVIGVKVWIYKGEKFE